jgi:hypothetical protein
MASGQPGQQRELGLAIDRTCRFKAPSRGAKVGGQELPKLGARAALRFGVDFLSFWHPGLKFAVATWWRFDGSTRLKSKKTEIEKAMKPRWLNWRARKDSNFRPPDS